MRSVLAALVGSSIFGIADAVQLASRWHFHSRDDGNDDNDAGQPWLVDLVDDPFVVNFHARGEPTRPRMLAMRGCSGSSAVMVYARSLLRYHGIPVPAASVPYFEHGEPVEPKDRGLPAELLNPKINWLYKEAGKDIGTAMEMQNDLRRSKGETLFFKGMLQHMQGTQTGSDEWDSLAEPFKRLNLLAVLGTRNNMLDQVICQVKDCFQDGYGFPVDENGQESDLCFNRRGAQDNPTAQRSNDEKQLLISAQHREMLESAFNESTGKAFFMDDVYRANLSVTNLIHNIHQEFHKVENTKRMLEWIGIDVKMVTEEDLLEFQTPMPGAFDRAVAAWCEFLTSLAVDPDVELVKKFLSQHANTYHEPPAHWRVIHNYDDIKAEIKKSKYAYMLREEGDSSEEAQLALERRTIVPDIHDPTP